MKSPTPTPQPSPSLIRQAQANVLANRFLWIRQNQLAQLVRNATTP